MPKFKPISTSYDIEKHPDADVFDPIAWYEGTGEDLGLPAGYLEEAAKLEAIVAANMAHEAELEAADAEGGSAEAGAADEGTPASVSEGEDHGR